MDPWKPREIWLRLGIDGVPLWHSNVLAMTMSCCSDLKEDLHMPQHSPLRHFVFAIMRSMETKENLLALFTAMGLPEALKQLDGAVFIVGGTLYRIRVFICGDHMCMYKVCGRDGPGSRRPDKCPCPYCNAPAPEVLSYSAAPRPYIQSPSACFIHIPVLQHAIDCAHGCVNILYTLLLPFAKHFLVESGARNFTHREWDELMRGLCVDQLDPMTHVRGEDASANEAVVSALARSITNARNFFKQRLYIQIVDALTIYSSEKVDFEGQSVFAWKLLDSLFAHTATIVEVAYTPKPDENDIVRVETAAAMSRRIFHALATNVGVDSTPWGHVWTCHVPQFLRTWGTLYPFLCHGLEGRWRMLKVEVKHSSHGQWKGDSNGFETVVRYSIAFWKLCAQGVRLVGRSMPIGKGGKALFDAFKEEIKG